MAPPHILSRPWSPTDFINSCSVSIITYSFIEHQEAWQFFWSSRLTTWMWNEIFTLGSCKDVSHLLEGCQSSSNVGIAPGEWVDSTYSRPANQKLHCINSVSHFTNPMWYISYVYTVSVRKKMNQFVTKVPKATLNGTILFLKVKKGFRFKNFIDRLVWYFDSHDNWYWGLFENCLNILEENWISVPKILSPP